MPNSAERQFGTWVRWLSAAERRDLVRLVDQEPQERWVEHYRALALARERIFRVGYRALFGGVRGSVSRLLGVGGVRRLPPVEIDPVTGRPYGEIIWEPVRPAPGFETPRIWAPPRPPREPYPGYPIGQPSFPVAPVVVPEPPGTELVGEVELVSRGEVGQRKPGFARRPIRE